MKYPCDIIKDLLPLYIDDVLSEESRRAVSEHLTECDSCQKYHAAITDAAMLNGDMPITSNEEEKTMSESLKKVKLQINKRQHRMVIAAILAVIIVLSGWQLLFNIPLKIVDSADVQVSVNNYKIQDLPYEIYGSTDNEGNTQVTISKYDDTDDNSPTYRVEIPAMPDSKLVVTEDMLDAGGYVSVITINSRYSMVNGDSDMEGDTLYYEPFHTTILGNSYTEEFSKTIQRLEFRPINKVCVMNYDGTETVLWEKK